MRIAGRRTARDPEQRLARLPGALGPVALLAVRARITGLAAEVAFWGIFILPWVLLGVVGSVGVVGRWLRLDAVEALRITVLEQAARVATADAVREYVAPLLDQILRKGSGGLGLVGFAAAAWSGSRLVGTLVVVIRTVDAAADPERAARSSWAQVRARSLGAWVMALLTLALAVPLVLLGPRVLAWLGLGPLSTVASWLAGAAVATLLLAGLYRAAVPREGWRSACWAAAVALTLWVIGSASLRLYLANLGQASPVQAFAAPVALMLWAWVTALAVLIGAVIDVVLRAQVRRD